jgi:hypothetical protein
MVLRPDENLAGDIHDVETGMSWINTDGTGAFETNSSLE